MGLTGTDSLLKQVGQRELYIRITGTVGQRELFIGFTRTIRKKRRLWITGTGMQLHNIIYAKFNSVLNERGQDFGISLLFKF